MYEWFIFLRGLSIGLIAALVLVCAVIFWRHYLAKMLVFFSLGICGYLLAPLLWGKTPLFYLSTAIADTIPLAFLLFTQAMFDDDSRPQRASLIAGCVYLVLGYAASYLPLLTGDSGRLYTIMGGLSRLLMACLLTYSFYVILRQWRADLVEPRRRMRIAVTVIVCTYILTVVVAESLIGSGTVPMWVEVANSTGIAFSTLFFIAFLALMGPGGLQRTKIEAGKPGASPLVVATQREIDSIIAAMEQDHIYRDMGLTIRSLGQAVSIPEHRLRQHINQVLDYRNFNDFLNRYRIDDATVKLRDPNSARTPVLTIAMDAGYRSMTTFNKAFKSRHGQTPVEYRQNQLPIT